MNDIVLFDSNKAQQLPAYLQSASVNVNADLLATIGAGGNRIGLKGNRFRLVVNGKEERVFDENYLDVIVVGVVPHISRMYYEKEFKEGEKAKPTCYSADGKAPPADLEGKKASACETCPMNEKGSKIVNGVKMKACGFFQRLVVMIAGDESGNYYKIDVKSQGLFGDSKPNANQFNLREYAKMLANRGVDASKVVTRLSFDTDSSVPKLMFKAYRFVDAGEFQRVVDAVGSTEVADMLKISMATIDLSNETSDDTSPAATAAAEVEQVTPPAKMEAAPVQQAVTQKVVEPVKRQYKPVPEKLGEFSIQDMLDNGWTAETLVAEGYLIDVTPVPEPPKPASPPKPPAPPAPKAPPKPPVQAATAVAAPAPPPPKASAPKPPSPAQSAAPAPQEVSSDAELADLIGSLNL